MKNIFLYNNTSGYRGGGAEINNIKHIEVENIKCTQNKGLLGSGLLITTIKSGYAKNIQIYNETVI